MRSGASSSRGHQDMVVEGRVGGDDVGVPSRGSIYSADLNEQRRFEHHVPLRPSNHLTCM